jgi:hypothetical protein
VYLFFAEHGNKGTQCHPQNSIPGNLPELNIKIIPEVDEFPCYDFSHLVQHNGK